MAIAHKSKDDNAEINEIQKKLDILLKRYVHDDVGVQYLSEAKDIISTQATACRRFMQLIVGMVAHVGGQFAFVNPDDCPEGQTYCILTKHRREMVMVQVRLVPLVEAEQMMRDVADAEIDTMAGNKDAN